MIDCLEYISSWMEFVEHICFGVFYDIECIVFWFAGSHDSYIYRIINII